MDSVIISFRILLLDDLATEMRKYTNTFKFRFYEIHFITGRVLGFPFLRNPSVTWKLLA